MLRKNYEHKKFEFNVTETRKGEIIDFSWVSWNVENFV